MSLVEIVVILTMMAQIQSGAEAEIIIPPVQQEGLSSWYGSEDGTNDNGMHGAITATGEPFIPSEQTCASRTIPLNTMVLIEHVETGNRAWCRVNDRGPYGAMLYDGEWAAMYYQRGRWVVRRRDENGWLPEEFYDEKPGRHRGVMDLSRGTAEALDFGFGAGLNEIRIRYFPLETGNSFTLQALR